MPWSCRGAFHVLCDSLESLQGGLVTQLTGFPHCPRRVSWAQPLARGQQRCRTPALKLQQGAASGRRLAGAARATWSHVWGQGRAPVGRGWSPAAEADRLPVRTGEVQQSSKLFLSTLGGQGSHLGAGKTSRRCFQSPQRDLLLCAQR